jgi:glutathione S-transferase
MDNYDRKGLRPAADTPERRAYNYWLHYAEGTFMPLMIVSLLIGRIETSPVPFFLKPVTKGIAGKVRDDYLDPNVKRNLDFMEKTLGESSWFCGDDLTAADCQMSFPVEAAEVRTTLKTDYPNLNAYLERVRGRPAYRKALEKGGPYELVGTRNRD